MRINADFSQRVVIRPGDVPWVASPAKGVERRMLDRIGDEVARATSFVRYAPRSSFAPHVHGGGEEFFVLEGEFADEAGRYAPGCYVRNPVASRHAPFTDTGCTIFVKLWQFDPQERWAAGTRSSPQDCDGGHEVLVLEGAYKDEHGHYPAGTWIRNPHGSRPPASSETGCLLYVKAGHLPAA